MKIHSIAISNIRSFCYDPSFNNEIFFEDSGLSFIIGPNGSGKSNLIEIITRLFSDVYGLDSNQYGLFDINSLISITDHPQNINIQTLIPATLTKNRITTDNLRSIKFTIVLDLSDIENLTFIKKNADMLKRISDKYYNITNNECGYDRIFNVDYVIPNQPTTYEVVLEEYEDNKFREKNITSLAVRYLRDYAWVNTLVDIYNSLLYKELFYQTEVAQPTTHNYQSTINSLGINEKSEPISNLNKTLLLMSVQDRVAGINLTYTNTDNSGINMVANLTSKKRRDIESSISKKSTLGSFSGATSEAFELIKVAIWEEVVRLVETNITIKDVINIINGEYELLRSFNSLIYTFGLNLRLSKIKIDYGSLVFSLNEYDYSIDSNDISSGQKAILNIAANLAVSKKLHSLVLIDEAENHLHPAIQSKLRDLLISQTHSQVFVITHSSVFINTKTLSSTIRFFSDNKGTKHIKCKEALRGNPKSIVNVLNYSNGARIFFTNKVLVVEGPSDQDFFTSIIRSRYPNEDIEVLSAGSDDQVIKWKNIINKLGVKVCTIRDLDTAKKGQIKKIRNIKKGRSLRALDVDPQEYKILIENINKAVKNYDFILRKGSIEEYIPGGVSNYNDKVGSMRLFLDSNNWDKQYLWPRELHGILKKIIEY